MNNLTENIDGRKFVLVSLFVILSLGMVSGQSLQDFDFEPETLDQDLTGGDVISIEGDFENTVSEDLQLNIVFSMDSENVSNWSESAITSIEGNYNEEQVLTCDNVENSEGLVYSCGVEGLDNPVTPGSNSFELSVETAVNLAPNTYELDLEVRSEAGFSEASESSTVENEEAQVTVESSDGSESTNVNIQTSEGENVDVERFSSLNLEPPTTNAQDVGSVNVDVTDSQGESASDASGTVTFTYSQERVENNNLDEESFDVYFYDEEVGEWTQDGVNVIDRDTEENRIEAEVDHFSLYALYGSEESSSSSSTDVSSRTVQSLSVSAEEDEIELDLQEQIIEVGSSTQLTVTAIYLDNSTEDVTSEANITSLDTEVIEVTDTGTVTGVSQGIADIQVDYEADFGQATETTTITIEESEEVSEENITDSEAQYEVVSDNLVQGEIGAVVIFEEDSENPVESAEIDVQGVEDLISEDGTATFRVPSNSEEVTVSVYVEETDTLITETYSVEPSQETTITGQFTEQATNPINLLVIILTALIFVGFMEYRSHIQLREKVRKLTS